MGNVANEFYQGPVGRIDAEGNPVITGSVIEGQQLWTVEPELYEIGRKITEDLKQYDAERFEPVPTSYVRDGVIYENKMMVPVLLLRELEAFMDAAGRTAPLADKAQELFLSGRASERWVRVAKDWQIGAAFANPTVGCSLTVTDEGYSACLVEAPSWE